MSFSLRTCCLLLFPFAVACSAGESSKDPVAEAKFQNEKRIGEEDVTKRQIRDAEFVVNAASRHMALQEINQIAQRKATAPDTRTLAQNSLAQLAPLQQELTRLAQQKGLVLPTGLGADQAQQVGELTALNGPAFDQKYAELLDKLVDNASGEYDDMSDDAYDGDIRALAARQLPSIKQQKDAVESLLEKLNP